MFKTLRIMLRHINYPEVQEAKYAVFRTNSEGFSISQLQLMLDRIKDEVPNWHMYEAVSIEEFRSFDAAGPD